MKRSTKQEVKTAITLLAVVIVMFLGLYVLLFRFKHFVGEQYFEPNIIVPSAILTSVLIVIMGIYFNQKNNKENKEYDEAKEQLKYLYGPLSAVVEKQEIYLEYLKMRRYDSKENFKIFALAYYKFFLTLRDIYLDNKAYGSWDLYMTFSSLQGKHELEKHNVLQNISENISEDEIIEQIALFEIQNAIHHGDDESSEFERKVSDILKVIAIDTVQIVNDKKPVNMYNNVRRIVLK